MKWGTKYQVLFVLIITSLCYINIVDNDFIFDDKVFVLNWVEIQDWSNVPSLLMGNVPDGHEGVYRPIRSLIYLTEFSLFGKNPMGYHIIGIIVHLLCTVLVYFIIKKLTDKSLIAFFSSLLFGVHPIHVEAISTIPASIDMFGILFCFVSFYLYLRKSKWALIWAGFAFFTYEMTLVLPFLILVYEFIFKKTKRSVPYFCVAIFFLFLRIIVFNIGKRGEYLGGSFFYTMLVMIKAVWRYIMLTIYPSNLNINRKIADGVFARASEVHIDKVLGMSLFNWDVFLPLLIIAVVIFFALKQKKSFLAFGILWFFIGLLPVLNIVPQIYLFAERYLYLASFGYCLILGYFFNELFRKQKMAIYAFSLLIFSFFMLTIMANTIYQNELTLWSNSVNKVPDSSFGRNGLGLAYDEIGRQDLAIIEFEKAIELRPEFDKPYNNLGNVYLLKGDVRAIEVFENAILNDVISPEIYSNLGAAYMLMGNYNKSVENLMLALNLKFDDAPTHLNLGMNYYYLGNGSSAIKELEIARDLRPDLFEIRATLGNLYQNAGRDNDARVEYEMALSIDSNHKYAKGIREEIGKLR